MSKSGFNCFIYYQGNLPSKHLQQLQNSLLRHAVSTRCESLNERSYPIATSFSEAQLIILWQQQFSAEPIKQLLSVELGETPELHRVICIVENHALSTKEHLILAKMGVAVIYPLNNDQLNIDEITASLLASISSLQNWKSALERDRQESRRLIMNIMRQNSEMGLMSQFLQECNAHQSIEKIGSELLAILNQLGLEAVSEICMRSRCVRIASSGRKPSLNEMQILQAANPKDRLVTCHRLAVVSFPELKLLIKNMPIYDEDRYGHCKDLIVQLGDIANARIRSLSVETAANERAAIIELVQQKSSDNIRHMHIIMKKLLTDAETSLGFLGCTEEQERVIIDLIETARGQLDALHDSNALLEDHLAGVMLNFGENSSGRSDRAIN